MYILGRTRRRRAWKKAAGACVGARACVRVHKSEQKGAKSCGRSRAVGQMFKQTSNYLNSIWDLWGVPALESIALSLSFSLPLLCCPIYPALPFAFVLLAFRLSLFFLFSSPRRRCVVGPRKKHERCISFDARVVPLFMSRRS